MTPSQDAAEPPQEATGTLQDAMETGRLADAIAAAVAGCPSAARLADGPVATYLPGRVVRGVAVRGSEVNVAVVARYGLPLPQVADEVRAAVGRVGPGLRIDVVIDDIDLSDGAT